ncbi:hypothetical protein MY11210_002264 [Beauveria gryllotalpidicola]
MAGSRPADVFFFASPRTLSSLLVRLLSEQTGWEQSGYFFHDAFEYAQISLSSCDTEMLAAREKAHENGHAFFTKSHIVELTNPSLFFAGLQSDACPSAVSVELETLLSPSPRTNPTLLSDEMLLSFGHPPAAVLRRNHIPYSIGVQLTKALSDWYTAAAASASATAGADILLGSKGYPIVVDADDLLQGDTVQRLARTIGMDPAQILQQWATKSTESMAPDQRPFVEDLWGSTAIDTAKSADGLDLEAKFKSWNELYGVEVGKTLADLTNNQMEGYLWLKSRKF